MNWPNAQTILAGVALLILGVIALLLIYLPIPPQNDRLLTFILGTIAGAITFAEGQKLLGPPPPPPPTQAP